MQRVHCILSSVLVKSEAAAVKPTRPLVSGGYKVIGCEGAVDGIWTRKTGMRRKGRLTWVYQPQSQVARYWPRHGGACLPPAESPLRGSGPCLGTLSRWSALWGGWLWQPPCLSKPGQRPRRPREVGTDTKARMVTGPPEANFPRQPPGWLSPGDRGVPGASSMATSETPGPESRDSQREGSRGRVVYPGPWAGRGEATADSPAPCPAGRGATVHPKPPCHTPSSRAQGVHGPPSGPSTLPVSARLPMPLAGRQAGRHTGLTVQGPHLGPHLAS